MARKSNLTDEQWAQIGKRLLEGEGASVIADDLTAQGLRITESTIRSHFERKGQKPASIRQVAEQVFQADTALRALPTEAQVKAMTLVQRMRTISESLALAAENSAKTAVRLTALANQEVQKVDDAQPHKSIANLKNTVMLTKAANEAASIPLNLLSANRETVKRFNDEPPPLDEELTPDRLKEGARRLAFMLHRAAHQEKN